MTLNLPSEIPTDTEGLHNYLYTLVEQLKHGFNNIGEENLTEDLYEQITDEGGVLNADRIRSGRIVSSDGKTYFDLDRDEIVTETEDGRKIVIKNGALYVKSGDYTTVQFGSYAPPSTGGNLRVLYGGTNVILLDSYNSGGRIYFNDTDGNGRLNLGVGASGDGYASYYNSSGTRTINIVGQTGEVYCEPQNVASGFSISPSTCSIVDAYRSAGICILRVAVQNSSAVSSGGTYSATVSFASGCTPMMTVQSEGYYDTIPLFATLQSDGTITVHNVSGSSLTSGRTARFQFIYPCS